MKTDELKAKSILKKYGKRLPEQWRGRRNAWHAWHQPSKVYFMSYKEFIDRVIEIEEDKPENEKPIRFKFFNVVRGKFLRTKAYADWQKAAADWQKDYADWQKADWHKADADWQKADADWQKADADWQKADADSILRLWKKECPDCPWDEKNNCMIF